MYMGLYGFPNLSMNQVYIACLCDLKQPIRMEQTTVAETIGAPWYFGEEPLDTRDMLCRHSAPSLLS
jgi:hypothetical protein